MDNTLFALEDDLARKRRLVVDGWLCHTKLTVTITIAECDIDPLVAVAVMV